MRIADLVAAMEAVAPLHLAEEWDNVGLLVGDLERRLVGPTLLTIDLSAVVLDEAIEMNAGAIVSYHPPIFAPLKKLTSESASGAILLRAVEHRIAVYSPHTALDAVSGGVTDWLLDQVGPSAGREALRASSGLGSGALCKVVVFVPESALSAVREAMGSAGAGVIGHYRSCSFFSKGTGSFMGDERTNPALGHRGRLEFVEEARLEMVCARAKVHAAVASMRAAHPYEEPAFDVYELVAPAAAGCGAGRIADLAVPVSLDEIADRLRRGLGSASLGVARAPGKGMARRAACVPGSGGSLLGDAVARGADLFITGEMKHHEVLAALEAGCSVILGGHTQTERGYLPVLAERLASIDRGFTPTVSAKDAAPIEWRE